MKDYLELLNIINRIDGRVDQLIRHAAAQKYSEENEQSNLIFNSIKNESSKSSQSDQ